MADLNNEIFLIAVLLVLLIAPPVEAYPKSHDVNSRNIKLYGLVALIVGKTMAVPHIFFSGEFYSQSQMNDNLDMVIQALEEYIEREMEDVYNGKFE